MDPNFVTEEEEEQLCILLVGLYHQRTPGSLSLSSNVGTGFCPYPGLVLYHINILPILPAMSHLLLLKGTPYLCTKETIYVCGSFFVSFVETIFEMEHL